MIDPLQYLWPAVEAVSPVFARAAVIRWPAGSKDKLLAANLLKPQGSATRIRCPECGQTHVAKPVPRKQPDGSVRFYIPCPQHLRAEVKDRDIQQWAANIEGLVHALAGALSLNGKPKALAGDRVWRCGRWTEQDVMRDVLFARGLRRKDALQFRRAITGAHTPIVLVGHEAPDDDFWQGSVPPILRLNEVATLTDGNLAIDGAQALGLIRATEVRNATAKKREGQKQRESVRRVLKQEIKSLVTEDNLVAAYKKYGSYNKAVDGLAAEGVSTNRSAIERAVKKQGGAKAVMRRDDSESIVRTVSSRRRDTPIKKRD